MDPKIIWGIIVMLLGTIAYFIRDKFANGATKSDLATIRTKSEEAHKIACEAITAQNEIKDNYLKRFEEVKAGIEGVRAQGNANHLAVIEKIGKLSDDLGRNFMQKTECKFLHQIGE